MLIKYLKFLDPVDPVNGWKYIICHIKCFFFIDAFNICSQIKIKFRKKDCLRFYLPLHNFFIFCTLITDLNAFFLMNCLSDLPHLINEYPVMLRFNVMVTLIGNQFTDKALVLRRHTALDQLI